MLVGVLALVLCGLLVVLVEQPAPQLSRPSTVRSWPGLLVAVAVAAALVVVVQTALSAAGLARRTEAPAGGRRQRWWTLPLVAAFLLLLVLALPDDLPEPEAEPALEAPVEQPTLGGEGDADVRVGPSPWVLALAGAAAAAALAAGLVQRRRDAERAAARAAHLDDDPSPAATATGRAREALDLSTDDPRTAVLTAFATLEQHLAAAGHERPAHQSQAAWVADVLRDGGAPERPVRMLDDAFHRARFSTQPVGADVVVELASALDDVRAVLQDTAAGRS